MTKNYYEILGVDKGAEQVDIKKAFRALSMEHHPDKGGDEEKFKEINEAYSTLSDPQKRGDYDNPMRNSGNPFEDLFRGFGAGGPFGHPRRPDPNAPRRGKNIVLEHLTPLHYFIFGGKLKINLSFNDACSDCSGTGAEERATCGNCNGTGQITQVQRTQGMTMRSVATCPKCTGRGFIASKQCTSCNGAASRVVEKKLVLDVPRDVSEGVVIGAAGEGHVGTNGAPPGDLIVKLHIRVPKAEDLTEEQRKVLEEL